MARLVAGLATPRNADNHGVAGGLMAHFDSDHVDDDGERGDEPDAKRRQLCQEDRADTDGTDWTRPCLLYTSPSPRDD